MKWVVYLPPIVSIYLIVISLFFAKGYLKRSIENFVQLTREQKDVKNENCNKAGFTSFSVTDLNTYEKDLRYVALTWSAKLGFINSMIMSIASLASIFEVTQSFHWFVGMLIVLLFIYVPMIWWIFKHGAIELAGMEMERINLRPSTFCSIILIVVNVFLLFAIGLNQYFSLTSQIPAAPTP